MCGDFRSKPMNLFSLVKHHVYNKVYPCVFFAKAIVLEDNNRRSLM